MPEVNEKTVADLPVAVIKSELKKRGLSTAGVKIVLSVRLSKAVRDETEAAEIVSKQANLDKIRLRINNKMNTNTTISTNNSLGGGSGDVNGEKKENVETEGPAQFDESQDLEIIDDPEAIKAIEEIKKPVEITSTEAVKQEKELKKVEEEEEPEGEDEFEEDDDVPASVQQQEEQKQETEKSENLEKEDQKQGKQEQDEQSEKEENTVDATSSSSISSAMTSNNLIQHSQEDEIFLDYEEDILEDPLDENMDHEDEKDKNEEAEEKKTSNKEEAGGVNNPELCSSSNDNKTILPTGGGVATSSETASAATTTTTTTNPSIQSSTLFADDAKKTSIWIRGMAPSTKASSVKQLASQYGKVVQSKIFNSRPIDGEVKNCFALVTFADTNAMDLAIESLQKKNYQGRVLRVEKVSESHLTGSAERIAKEKRDAEEKLKVAAADPTSSPSTAPPPANQPEPPKKRAIIMPPDSNSPQKKTSSSINNDNNQKARQTIQAPSVSVVVVNNKNNNNKSNNNGEKRVKRPQIQPPERSRSREAGSNGGKEKSAIKRKPITYGSDDGDEYVTTEQRNSRAKERDSRKIISAATSSRPSRVIVSPIRSTSRSGGKGAAASIPDSLIISARVDTSGCRGGGMTIKRSVERVVPNNISTSQLRRQQAVAPPQPPSMSRRAAERLSPPPRASYQTEQYSRERSSRYVSPDRVPQFNRRPQQMQHHYQEMEPQQHPRGERGRRVGHSGDDGRHGRIMIEVEEEPPRRRHHDDRIIEEQARRQLEMLEQSQSEALHYQKMELIREREKLRFEAEKLERVKLEVELSRQKMALDQAAAAVKAAKQAGNGDDPKQQRRNDRGDRGDRGRNEDRGSNTRRRPANDRLSPVTAVKMQKDNRRGGASRGGNGNGGQRRDNLEARQKSSTVAPVTSRHTTSYGIQSTGLAQTASTPRGTISSSLHNHHHNPHQQLQQEYVKMFVDPLTRVTSSGNAISGSSNNNNFRQGASGVISSGSYDTQSTIGGYQNLGYPEPNVYPSSVVWTGHDGQGHMSSDINWTANSSTSSTTAPAMKYPWQAPQQPGSNYHHQSTSSSTKRGNYGYQNRNNNY